MPFSFSGKLFKKKNTSKSRDARDIQGHVQGEVTEVDASSDTSQFGMFVLKDQPSDLAKAVDLVAIHGLNGHYLNTWTATDAAGRKVIWLKDLLPKQLPDARIMSYGYNSAVLFSKSVAGIGSFAEQLLEDLRSWRRTQAEQDRPVIFICHSLGGIVVKQASNLATIALVRAHERDRYSGLLSHVFGIAFFGTPHRGSDLASWATIIGNLSAAASFGMSTNITFMKDLKGRSEVLDNISKSFVERGKGLKILSFYETQKMDNLNSLVVEKQSATLDLPNEATIALNGTHRTICKFASENEQRYRTVWSNLQEMVTPVIINETLSGPETACLSTLYISDYEEHRNRIESPVPGTCTWILGHPKYKEWLEAETASLLWVTADPGCGKSVLTSFLVDIRASDNALATTCYFFFKDDNDQQRRSRYAIASLLHQIYTSQPSLIRHALKLHQSKEKAVSANFLDLWKVFLDTVEDERAGKVVCLIDALDECQPASRQEFMAALVNYFSSKAQQQSHASKLKVLVTSRPENSIKRAFQNLPRIQLKGEDETESISKDVAILVHVSIDQLQNAGLPQGLLLKLQKQLIDGADRTFLWVSLIIQFLKDASESGASQNQLDAIVQSRDIDEVYNRLLQGSAAPLKAKSMLQIVLAATSPLSLDELSVASTLKWKHKTLKDLEDDLIHPFDNHIRALCGNFLRIIQGKVYLVHQTARSFLLKPHRPRNVGSIKGTLLPNIKSASKYEESLELLLDDGYDDIDANKANGGSSAHQHLMNVHRSKEFQMKVFEKAKRILNEVRTPNEKVTIQRWVKERLAKVKSEEHESQCLSDIQTYFEQVSTMIAQTNLRPILKEFSERGKHWKRVKQGLHNSPTSKLGETYYGFFNHSTSLSEAHYYLLKACIHFLQLLSPEGQNVTALSTINWSCSMMEPFFTYAADSWPIHYSEARSELTIPTIQVCRELCSPVSPSFPFWTNHNKLYTLEFPRGRVDIRGHISDHASEVSRTFLGLFFQEEQDMKGYEKKPASDESLRDHALIVEALDSDEEQEGDDGLRMNRNESVETSLEKSEVEEHLSRSHRFREYRRAGLMSPSPHKSTGAYVPSSFLDSMFEPVNRAKDPKHSDSSPLKLYGKQMGTPFGS